MTRLEQKDIIAFEHAQMGWAQTSFLICGDIISPVLPLSCVQEHDAIMAEGVQEWGEKEDWDVEANGRTGSQIDGQIKHLQNSQQMHFLWICSEKINGKTKITPQVNQLIKVSVVKCKANIHFLYLLIQTLCIVSRMKRFGGEVCFIFPCLWRCYVHVRVWLYVMMCWR